MKKFFACMLSVLLAVSLCACGGIISYKDTNGEDDFTLQTITESDILTKNRFTAIASVSVNNNGSSRLDIGSLSGVKKLETFSGGSSYDITLSLSTKSGNVRLVLCTKDAILYEFSPNGDDQTYHLEKQNKTVYLKIAGEEAAFKLEYKTEKK